MLGTQQNRNAIYLCEQAAEKIIRAVLTSEGIHAGIRHQLDAMVDQLNQSNPITPLLRKIEHLGAYATSYRYPTSTGRITAPPDWTKFETDANRVSDVLTAVATQLGVAL